MAVLSSRPHRTKPAGSYVKPDWKGYLKLALIIILFIVLAVIFFEFIAVPKTPATVEQIKSVIVDQGYEPRDVTEAYYKNDALSKASLNKCIAFYHEDIHFEYFELNNDNMAQKIYSQFHRKIVDSYNASHIIETENKKANYVIYTLDNGERYNVAIYVGHTAVYAYCNSENKNEINKILDAIDYLEP